MDKLEQGEEVGRGSAESLFANYLQVFGCNFSFVGVSCNLNFHFHFYFLGSIRGHIYIYIHPAISQRRKYQIFVQTLV